MHDTCCHTPRGESLCSCKTLVVVGACLHLAVGCYVSVALTSGNYANFHIETFAYFYFFFVIYEAFDIVINKSSACCRMLWNVPTVLHEHKLSFVPKSHDVCWSTYMYMNMYIPVSTYMQAEHS